jgi:hypothetical protein
MIPETTDCPTCGHTVLISSWQWCAVEASTRNWIGCRVDCPHVVLSSRSSNFTMWTFHPSYPHRPNVTENRFNPTGAQRIVTGIRSIVLSARPAVVSSGTDQYIPFRSSPALTATGPNISIARHFNCTRVQPHVDTKSQLRACNVSYSWRGEVGCQKSLADDR